MKKLLQCTALGAAVGLALFAGEGLAIRSGAAGLNFDTEGPFAALMAAVKPQLPGLLARIALVYLLGGAVLGAVAGLLSKAWRSRTAFPLLLAALWILLAWSHAIERPALFDDVAWLMPVLAVLVRHGEPWHPALAAGALALVHAVPLVLRLRDKPRRVAAAAAATLLLMGAIAAPPKKHPLVLLIGIDALRPDRVASLPNLSAFVRDATVFTRAYTPIAQTEPAWRAMLTGRWPHRAGSRYPLTAELRWAELPTFPEAMAKRGFSTFFETDCSRFNFQPEQSGFQHRRQPPRGAINFALEKLRFRGVGLLADNALGAWLVPELIENRAIAGIHDPVGYARRLAGRIVNAAEEGPTLYAFHATAAHFPGDPVYPFYRQRVRDDAPLSRRLRMVFRPIASGTAASGEWSRADSEALYDELIAQADMQLGVILDALKAADLYSRATIIVFSDHGESFHSDMPALAGATPVHGARLSEEENRIFLAMKMELAKGPDTVDDLVRMIDIGPTVLGAPLGDGVPLGTRSDLKLYAETGFTHASPAAFDAEHLALAPRTFDAYRVRPNGVVEMNDAAHEAVLKEKDVGAFDGTHWLVRQPLKDGTVRERCDGNCEALSAFLEETTR